MKRSCFLKSAAALVSLAAIPFQSFAKKFRVGKGLVVKAGKDRSDKPLSLMEGDTFFTKVSGKDTDGDLYVFESIRVKEGGPSFHMHLEQDEYWYILKGEFLFKVGDEEFMAREGDSVFGPRMVPHAFAKVGEEEAKLLITFQPAGRMEELFQKISEGKAHGLTEEQQAGFVAEHGLKRIGPPLRQTKKW
jgi:mannose-6-phosphate isomerase-like protein (cupin superfamily)